MREIFDQNGMFDIFSGFLFLDQWEGVEFNAAIGF